jgi:DNA-binding SARP family transcriptional activator
LAADHSQLHRSDRAKSRSCISTDVEDFEQAVRGRQFERAVDVYRGPFADKMRTGPTEDAERRLEEIRTRYARDHERALEALAHNASARQEYEVEAGWWRDLVNLRRESSRFAKRLIEALVGAGERAEALRFALQHERLLATEYNTRPTSNSRL